MRTATTNWLTAAQRTPTALEQDAGYSPVMLVDLLGVNRSFATRSFAPTGARTIGDGWVLGGGLVLGEQYSAYELDLIDGGIGDVGVELSETDNTVRLRGTRVQLLNYSTLLTDLGLLDNAKVRLRLGFDGLGMDDFLSIWGGVIDRAQDNLETIDLELIDGSVQRHRTLSTAIDPRFFPGAPAASRNLAIPILLGINTDAPTIQVSGEAAGALAFAMTTGSSECYLREYGAPFPATGTITIDAETGVTYAGRRLVTIQGITYLELNGLVRGSPASHTPGDDVTLTSVQYVYIIGYQISTLQRVREDGIVLSSGYTLSAFNADRAVSLLTFTAARGTITVDVNAANISMVNLLTNAGFEAGTTAGWTTGSGATATIQTATPAPAEGTYYLELTGDEDVYKDFYQEWSTIIGEDYQLQLSYQNADSDLLANGGFETGDLTGWTIDAALSQGYTIEVTAPGFADGAVSLRVLRSNGQHTQYFLEFYQDVTTVASSSYTAIIRHISQRITAFDGAGSSTSFFYRISALVGYKLGTPTNPTLYANVTTLSPAFVIENGRTVVSPDAGYRQDMQTFTATTTTTRVTIRVVGQGANAQTGGGVINPPPCRLDGLRLQLSSAVDSSEAGFQLGTPADPDAYSAGDLPLAYYWASKTATFRATATTARLTLQSRYTITGSVKPSYFDDVRIQRIFTIHAGSGGQNPIEAIRYIIDTFLPQCRYDPVSFQAAYLARLDWKFGTVLTDPGDSKALLAKMAQQCACLLFEDVDGVYKLVPLDQDQEPVYGFGRSNIVEGSFAILDEPIDNVATSVYIYFGARTGGSMSPEDFQGVTYATAEETTHPDNPTLTTLCQTALSQYRRERRIDIFADFVADFYTANLLLASEVMRRTTRQKYYTFDTWLDAAPLELGDVVLVLDPRYTESYPFLCEVTAPGLAINAATVRLTARSLGPAGYDDECDYDPIILDIGGYDDEAEYSLSLAEGEGYDDEAES